MHPRAQRAARYETVERESRMGDILGYARVATGDQGIALLSLEEKIDSSSAAGELVFHVFGAIAHLERQLTLERTRDGIAAARAEGKRPGRSTVDREMRRLGISRPD